VTDLYADASALAKLLVEEPETAALLAFVKTETSEPTSSAVVEMELTRAVRLRNPAAGAELRELLDHMTLVPVRDRVLDLAATLADARLRTLDAIHLASAVTIGARRMLVYDRRLAEAADAAGIAVIAPGR